MNFWKYTTGIASLIFCGTSVVFTVGLWISIPAVGAGQLVAGLTAAALELCKFSFAPLGLWLRNQDRFIGNVLLFLWPFLVLVSIAATVGFLESHTTEQQQSDAVNSVEYQTLKQQLNSYNQRINNINGIIADYAATDYRKVAVKTDERLDELEAKRDKTLARLKDVQRGSTDSAQAAFSGMAVLAHVDTQLLQHSAFLALAVITDLVGLVALLAFNSALTVTSGKDDALNDPERIERSVKGNPSEKTQQREVPIQKTDSPLTPEQQQLAKRITSGEFGARPVLRKLNNMFEGGNNFVRPVFEWLLNSGDMKRDGKGFLLITQG
ncbi:hypothetical protein [Microbulbifer epialgicus]|uniref:Uncharacterized protein n=1 Tax=Microbulbifer epialgicus TaxID=393907 RepID=A0ABV4NXQ4_9GAMM